MAEIVLGAVIQAAVEIGANWLLQEGSRLYWLRGDIEWIETTMTHMESYLKDADSKREGSQGVANFINVVRDLVLDVEDLLEEFLPLITRYKGRRFLGFFKKRSRVSYISYTAHRLAMEIQKIRRRVEAIEKARTTFAIMESNESPSTDTLDERQTFPYTEEPNIVGFEEHIENLNAELQHLNISIIGMGGMGKTTLARKVYNSIKSDFECSAWVCVSQDPVVENIMQDVARQVGFKEEVRMMNAGEWKKDVELHLNEFLGGKKYVIVFDDIWKEKAWHDIRRRVPINLENGSRIIVTSRIKDVGLSIGKTSYLHELSPLSPDDSWKLFSKIVISSGDSMEFEYIGQEIVKRCGGIPLAIVVATGLLLGKKEEFEWRAVPGSMGQEEDKCHKILALSYADLPIELKPCFLYFGAFSEDYEISAFSLINMWVAEGFVKARGRQEPEDVGEYYLSNLIARNLVQVVKRKYNGRIKSCRIHDLLHNLCILEAGRINFFDIAGNDVHSFGSRVRRVSTHVTSVKACKSLECQTHKLRAFLSFNENMDLKTKNLKNLLGSFKFLRVLFLQCQGTNRLPNEIGELSNLSCICLRRNWESFDCGMELPSSMGNLRNLLTLDVRCPLSYIRVPPCIWKMRKLRHLLLNGFGEVRRSNSWWGSNNHHEIEEVGLPNLQTMSMIRGGDIWPGLLRTCTNLRRLAIFEPTEEIMEVVSSPSDDDNAAAPPVFEKLEHLKLCVVKGRLNLSGYKNLHTLKLAGEMRKLPNPNEMPQSLTKLTFGNCELEEDPLEGLKTLPNLKILELGGHTYWGKKMNCSGGADSFPQLQVLIFSCLIRLEEVSVEEEGSMPMLREFRVIWCDALKVIPEKLRNKMIITPTPREFAGIEEEEEEEEEERSSKRVIDCLALRVIPKKFRNKMMTATRN